MKGQLIKNYINKLTVNDVNNLAISHNINLNQQELDFIYNKIKNNYETLLYGNNELIFNELKNKVSNDNYQKIKNLFNEYKYKYQSLL